ncbi:helix-turn-helix domain-containing protein [Blautia sp.]|uniref:helix-turn-helix domain-containing protein n=1 Tax=Blautia sp. TaxID=1955243 RepID=UPI003FA491D1
MNHIVKKQTGKTILEYEQFIYLDEARQILADTDKSISAIIEELGFSNRSHFYRLFKADIWRNTSLRLSQTNPYLTSVSKGQLPFVR